MNKVKTIALFLTAFITMSNSAYAEVTMLQPDDFVGFTFWLVSIACLATTIFLFLERGSIIPGWKTSVTVAGIVTGIAFIHSMYMRNIWVTTGDSPTIYRYIDWIITMPLQMIQFYLILATVRKVPKSLFWKLLIGSIVVVLAAYLGSSENIPSMVGYVISIGGWIYILYEIYSGEAGRAVAKSGNKPMVSAYVSMRMIVTVGWAIYPLGYIFGYITNSLDNTLLNLSLIHI